MTNGASAAERHRLHLQNLQRRKQLEKEAEAARTRSRQGVEELERGFLNCFNGANRDLAPRQCATKPHREAPVRRCLRVPGAVPVHAPLTHREAWAETDDEDLIKRLVQQRPRGRRVAAGVQRRMRDELRKLQGGQVVQQGSRQMVEQTRRICSGSAAGVSVVGFSCRDRGRRELRRVVTLLIRCP